MEPKYIKFLRENYPEYYEEMMKDRNWLCEWRDKKIEQLQADFAQLEVYLFDARNDNAKLQAENKLLQMPRLDLIKQLQADNERLKEKHAVEIVAAQRLCEIYFEIAERYISAMQIRKLRDDKINQALRTERRENERC